MNVLFAKDCRLALDALRPWLVILLGLIATAAGMTFLPFDAMPFGLRGASVAEATSAIGGMAGLAGVAIAAWIAATVALGDRRHGARALATVLPVPGPRLALSKVAAIAAGVLVVSVAAIALHELAPVASVGKRFGPGAAPTVVLAMAAIGASLALGVAPLARTVFQTVMIALLLAMLGGLAGFLAGAATAPMAASDVRRVAEAVGEDLPLRQAIERVTVLAAAAGIVGAALVALPFGVRALARPVAASAVFAACAVAVVVAAAAGAIAAPAAFRSDKIQHWPVYTMRDDLLASDEEIIAAIRSVGATIRGASTVPPVPHPVDAPPATGLGGLLDDARGLGAAWTRALVGRQRVERLAPHEREASPIARALREAEDQSTWAAAVLSLRLIPANDPRMLRAAIEVVRRYPDVPEIRRVLDFPVAKAGGWTNQRSPLPDLTASDPAASEAADGTLVQRLQWLLDIDRFADDHAAIRQALEHLRGVSARRAAAERRS